MPQQPMQQQPGMPPPVGGMPAPMPAHGAPPQQQYGQMQGHAPARSGTNIPALISLVFVVIAVLVMVLISGPLFYAAPISALIAIVLGSVGKRMARRGAGMRGLAQTGFVLGWCLLIISLLIIGATLLLDSLDTQGENLQDQIKELIGN